MDEPGLAPLEIAYGHVLGCGARVRLPRSTLDPLAALEAAIEPAVRRSPCLVSFSGGIDSTLVLAVATRVARRQGLALPVPITWRFVSAPAAEESPWQEAAVAALGLPDWERLTGGGELDLVGPLAQRVLASHGLLHPPNAFLHEPLLARAAGGALLTGIGGDQVLGLWRGRAAADVLARRRRPSPRTALTLLRCTAPKPARTAWERGRVGRYRWLTAPAQREVAALLARERASEPVGWTAHLGWQLGRRNTRLLTATIEAIARGAGACVINPLLDDGFISALARAGGRLGSGDRRTTVAALFGQVMPASVLERRGKARFHQVFWNEHTCRLTRSWDGVGLDERLVDREALRTLWASEDPPLQTALLIQQLWLFGHQVDAAPTEAACSPISS